MSWECPKCAMIYSKEKDSCECGYMKGQSFENAERPIDENTKEERSSKSISKANSNNQMIKGGVIAIGALILMGGLYFGYSALSCHTCLKKASAHCMDKAKKLHADGVESDQYWARQGVNVNGALSVDGAYQICKKEMVSRNWRRCGCENFK